MSSLRLLSAALVLACVSLVAMHAEATITLPSVISSNMVLQRGPSNVIWGWADEDSAVTVTLMSAYESLGGMTYADSNGAWSYDFSSGSDEGIAAGTGYNITISDPDSTVVLTNIAFGDVILCSGQSNMELTVGGTNNAAAEIADSIHYPNLRMFTLSKVFSLTPLTTVTSKNSSFNWTVSSPGAFDQGSWDVFSGTCFYTGRNLYKALGGKVPIGLVASDWGGTPVEAWSSPAALSECNTFPDDFGVTAHSVIDFVADHIWDAFPIPLSPANAIISYPLNQNNNSVLWNAMINPILQMRFNLAVWYQGEANAYAPQAYKCRFPAMITDWRKNFNLDLPFFFVQIAAFPEGGPNWPIQQVAQTAALALPLTGMASAMDLGDPTSPNGSIHPRDKQTVGLRLADSILNVVYGHKNIVATGPLPVDLVGIGPQPYSSVNLTFSAIPSSLGLQFDGTENCNFNMTGGCCMQNPFEVQTSPSMKWKRVMESNIEGFTVTLVLPQTFDTAVIGVRYAFQAYAECALYNEADLPMTPFTQSINKKANTQPTPITLTEE